MKYWLLICGMCVLVTGCLISGCEKDDTVVAATAATPHASVSLPPEGQFYRVIGNAKGIEGYIIQYDQTMYRGGEPSSAAGMEELKKYGIATIISITPTDFERQEAQKHGIKLVELPFEKSGVPAQALEAFLQSIDEDKGPFYVHCHGGTHRAAILCMAWRVHRQQWDYEKAMIEFGRLGGSLRDDYRMLESIRSVPTTSQP